MPGMGQSNTACVTEVGQHIVQLLASTRDERRRVSERYRALLPSIDPAQVILHMRVCNGAFPKLRAEVGDWGEVGRPEQGTLYKVTTAPGVRPQYFTISGDDVVRVCRAS